MSTNTKILSIDRDFSIRYALKKLMAGSAPSSSHMNPKKSIDKTTQKMLCQSAVFKLVFVFFLLKKPRSNTTARMITIKNTRYVISVFPT